jgi:ribonuclease-3
LGLAVAEFLFDRYPDRNEGFLTRTRSKLVSGKAISKYAKTMGLGNLIQMSDDMERAGGRNNATLLANAFEAILGALYLDHGLDAARDFTLHTIDDQVNLTELVSRKENYKSMLLEYAQACGWKQPRYQVVEEKGPSHQREFTVDVLLNNEALGRGIGRSKKSAEQRAAREAMLNLKDRKKKEGKPPSS